VARIFLIIIAGLALWTPVPSIAQVCREDLTPTSPFYLTTVSENTAEPFQFGKTARVVEGRGRKTGHRKDEVSAEKFFKSRTGIDSKWIGRGTRVKVFGNVAEAVSSDHLVKIQVVRPETRYSKFYAGPKVKKGDQGFISRRALRKLNDSDVFVVKSDIAVLQLSTMKVASFGSGMALKPLMNGDFYRVLRCREAPGAAEELSYIFATYDPASRQFRTPVAVMPSAQSCCGVDSIPEPDFKKMVSLQDTLNGVYAGKRTLGLQDLEINDWGMARVPMRTLNPPRGAGITEESFDGSFVHYQGRSPAGSNVWAHPDSLCALSRITSAWQDLCREKNPQKCVPQIGDFSFITPGKAKGRVQDPLGHRFHFRGNCVDMRPFRKDGKQIPMDLALEPRQYDAALTRRFVELLVKSGVTPIYLNDPSLISDPALGHGPQACDLSNPLTDIGKRVQSCPGHGNHLHFCMEPGRVQGCTN